jgi:hypothetical protein
MTTIQLFGILPATLILWIASQILAATPEDQATLRWFRFYLITLLSLLVILLLANPGFNQVTSFLWLILTPVAGGVLAIVLFLIFSDRTVRSKDNRKSLFLFLFGMVLIILLGVLYRDALTPLMFSLVGIFLAFVWWMWEKFGKKYLLYGVIQILLLSVSLWNVDLNYPLIESPKWLSAILQITLFFLPAISIAIAAHLVFDLVSGDITNKIFKVIFGVVLVLFTIFMLGYQMYLASIWDAATDGLWSPLLLMLASMASIAAGIIMAWFLPGWRRLAALAFALLVPLSMLYPNWIGTYGPDREWGMSPAHITEQRAETIANAIQGYYEDHGEYPASLKSLFPGNLVYIPKPMMIPGQAWCYEGGQDYFRLGYVYRKYFSAQTSVLIHASAGEPPNPDWPCEGEAAKYPGFPE